MHFVDSREYTPSLDITIGPQPYEYQTASSHQNCPPFPKFLSTLGTKNTRPPNHRSPFLEWLTAYDRVVLENHPDSHFENFSPHRGDSEGCSPAGGDQPPPVPLSLTPTLQVFLVRGHYLIPSYRRNFQPLLLPLLFVRGVM